VQEAFCFQAACACTCHHIGYQQFVDTVSCKAFVGIYRISVELKHNYSLLDPQELMPFFKIMSSKVVSVSFQLFLQFMNDTC